MISAYFHFPGLISLFPQKPLPVKTLLSIIETPHSDYVKLYHGRSRISYRETLSLVFKKCYLLLYY